MIDKAHELPVSWQAKLLKISRGTVYYLPKPIKALGETTCLSSVSGAV